MAAIVAFQDGNWDTASTWVGNIKPSIGDTVYANNKIITIDTDVILNNAATLSSGNFVVSQWYQIVTPGNTNFTLIGAANSTTGTYFIATSAGALGQTGVARPIGTLTTAASSANPYPAAGGRFQLSGSLLSDRLIYADLRAGTTPCLSAALTTGTYVVSGNFITGGTSIGAHGIDNTLNSSLSVFNNSLMLTTTNITGPVLTQTYAINNSTTGNVSINNATITKSSVSTTIPGIIHSGTGSLTFNSCALNGIYLVLNFSTGTINVNNVNFNGSAGGGNDFFQIIYNLVGGRVNINNCNIRAFSGNNVGIIHNQGLGIITATNSTINTINGGGGCSCLLNNGAGQIFVDNCTVTANQFNEVNPIKMPSSGSLVITNSVLQNQIINGGGNAHVVHIQSTSAGSAIIRNCILIGGSGNAGDTAAVGALGSGSTTRIDNCVLQPGSIAAAVYSTNASANIIFSNVNILYASTGLSPIYAPSYRIDPVPTNSFIRYARNGTGVGSDAWLYQFTTDSLSAFSMPPVSSVRAGVQFANNTLTGTCNVPSPSSVSFGTLVDNTSGTAVVSVNDLFQIFSTPLSSLTTPNTIGSRIRTAATTEATGNLIASFTNG
jgi:hypothetical protein